MPGYISSVRNFYWRCQIVQTYLKNNNFWHWQSPYSDKNYWRHQHIPRNFKEGKGLRDLALWFLRQASQGKKKALWIWVWLLYKKWSVCSLSLGVVPRLATIIHKQFETNSRFMWNGALQKKFNFCFSRVFC